MAFPRLFKFGGTSMGTPQSIDGVLKLVTDASKENPLAVVLSAMSGVTDLLVKAMDMAKEQKNYDDILVTIKQKHLDVAGRILSGPRLNEYGEFLQAILKETAKLLSSVEHMRTIPEPIWDLVAGQGEYLSSKMFHAICLEKNLKAQWLDARQYLFVKHLNTGPSVDWEKGKKKLGELIDPTAKLVITPGFVATTHDNVPTTLKRNGSDHSASIVGSLLDCKEVVIWTDVDGILSADPRLVKSAKVLPFMTYTEALELAYFGAKVIHPKTMIPAMEKNIRLVIKNTFNPDHPGTLIGPSPKKSQASSLEGDVVRGVTSIDSISLLTLEGAGMIGVPGIAEKMFSALKNQNISVIMIGQGSSEYSICIAIRTLDGERAKSAVEEAFQIELTKKHIQSVELINGCAIVALVGEGMKYQEGVAATLFTAMARAHISVKMIAQGSSEHNISVVIDGQMLMRALNVVHGAFYLSRLTLGLFLLGPGLIGKTLLEQIKKNLPTLQETLGLDIKLLGVGNSKKMISGDDLLGEWEQKLAGGETANLKELVAQMPLNPMAHKIVLDCTSSDEVAQHYSSLLSQGIHVITPNKKAGSGPLARYNEIMQSVSRRRKEKFLGKRGHFFYETTVGAGLPVISTLQDLLKTGDRIIAIEGVFSGTLSYLFNQLANGVSFSSAVLDAKQKGYTEPDPRDDLSGLDVARKLIILARETGLQLELTDVEIQGLVPKQLTDLSVQDFLQKLPTLDDEWKKNLTQATAKKEVLRYVGRIDQHGKASVGICSMPLTHAFSRLQGSDNIIAFTTERYHQNPLIIQGPGAGAAVTAAGVFADLLRLAEHLRAAP